MTSSSTAQNATLDPSYRIPLTLIIVALPLGLLKVWLAIAIALFGTFLLYQAATLRLVFTDTDLDIYRGESQIRRFPYQEWQTWEIFWSPIPILFYFREVNSIHFLPILFNPLELRVQLEARVPQQSE
ncbi:MAG: DUF3119 family protein [Cyanobacteria bacterium P01_H01_bin.58]